ncbi:hypothetical protein EDB84DRAFT_1471251 [Lactarius hengduanensis]|nr:hypothetical protein EDB84DRAFT_1547876 [Lactarius hengduanensis]KAH9028182.1 hypothetical protein EDB84DRAFT_1499103 [Lactarius hengduanensis]KAH9036061.1 hypothetical protein EDB84DRAFT_1483574 [Lactarius hengduanensis]KAH9043990.1 hypothetical protein EDB84DRAFT_1471251 [Lactarius hengduanensis]
MYDITPNLSWVFSLVSSNTLFQQICVAFSKIVGIWWSGPLLFTTPLSSLLLVMISYLQILLYLLYFFWAKRNTGKG